MSMVKGRKLSKRASEIHNFIKQIKKLLKSSHKDHLVLNLDKFAKELFGETTVLAMGASQTKGVHKDVRRCITKFVDIAAENAAKSKADDNGFGFSLVPIPMEGVKGKWDIHRPTFDQALSAFNPGWKMAGVLISTAMNGDVAAAYIAHNMMKGAGFIRKGAERRDNLKTGKLLSDASLLQLENAIVPRSNRVVPEARHALLPAKVQEVLFKGTIKSPVGEEERIPTTGSYFS